GRMVILIDDIMTTGSTLRSCERVLREAGARVYAALTLSMVPGDADGLQLPRPALTACFNRSGPLNLL
ncbi:MAG: ComF family protein, partial [Scardovia wiggsiae]